MLKPLILNRRHEYKATVSKKITTGSFNVWHDQIISEGIKDTNQPTRIAVHFENKLAAILYVKTTVIAPKKQLRAAGGNLPVHPVIKYNVPTR